MSSDDDENAQLYDELRELQELLGINYRPTLSQQQPRRAGGPSALAQEWEDLTSFEEAAAAITVAGQGAAAEGSERLREEPSGAERNTAPEQDPRLTAVEGRGQAAVIAHALAENQALQRRLKAGLASLNRASDRMSALRAAVQDLKVKYKGSRPGVAQPQATGASRFWTAGGKAPEPNADTKRLLGAYQYLPHAFGSFAWSESESAALAQAVLTTVQEVMLNEQLAEFLDTVSHAEFRRASETLKALHHDSPEVKAAAAKLDGRQWAKVAQLAGGKRSAADCRCHWAAALAADRGPWSPGEHARMEEIARRHDHRNWPAIAAELGTGRHPSECLARWQRGTTAAAPAKKWDTAEDARLQAAVKRHGRNWQAIAAEVGGGRTAANCLQRFTRRGAGTELKKGKWDKEEDQLLLQAVSTEGRKWSLVAKHVPGRSDVQCRERFCNVLDPSVNAHPWDSDEDQRLKEAVERNAAEDGSISWVGVAADMPGRTDNQVARRWKQYSRGLKPGQRRRRKKPSARAEAGEAQEPAEESKGRKPAAKRRKGQLAVDGEQ